MSAAMGDGELDVIEPIAVVGLSCRLPGATTPQQLWSNLLAGRSAVRRFAASDATVVPGRPAVLGHPAFVGAEGVLAGIDLFDAELFGCSPREAEITDPQHRVGLEVAWDAFETAGYDPALIDDPVGVFVSASLSSYLVRNLAVDPEAAGALGGLSLITHNDKDFFATSLSYRLGLRGPSVALGSACSSSLVAVHLAARSLQSFECGMALAGGVSIQVPQQQGYLHSPDSIYSAAGACRPFAQEADGTVGGSGAGMVLLKRLSDARRDGDHVHAVLLGSALNNDGRDKVGFTAPSVRGQREVVAEAHAFSGISADTVGYVEAHGTGTALGDPVEIQALTEAFAHTTDRRQFCAVGSSKAIVGHLDAAAGVVGLISAVLVAREATVPPSPGFRTPNPAIDFANSPFFVPTEARALTGPLGERRVAVSSFGVGGTNAHAVLQEPPRAPSRPDSGDDVLLLSGRDGQAVAEAAGRLAQQLISQQTTPLADVARSLAGKRAFRHRCAVLAPDRATAMAGLAAAADRRSMSACVDRQVTFTLPDLASLDPAALVALAAEPVVSDALEALWAEASLAGIAVPDLRDGGAPARRIHAFAVQHAMVTAMARWGVHPATVSGSGLGELVAAVTAGMLTPMQALTALAAPSEHERHAALADPPPTKPSIPCLDTGGRALAAEDVLGLSVAPCAGAARRTRIEGQGAFTPTLDIACGAPVETDQDLSDHDERAVWLPGALAPVLAALWRAGADLRLDDAYRLRGARRAPVPGHPFQRSRYWVGPSPYPDASAAAVAADLDDVLSHGRPRTLAERPAARKALDHLCAELALACVASGPLGDDVLREGVTAEELAAQLEVLPAYRPFLDYQLDLLVQGGVLAQESNCYRLGAPRTARPEAVVARIREDFPDLAGIAELLLRCGSGYREAIRREGAGLAVLHPPDGYDPVAEFTSGETTPHSWVEPLAVVVARLARRMASGRRTPLRVLEVGAGGGRLSRHLAEALEGTDAEWTVTDISPHFVAKLSEHALAAGIRTAVFDITADPGPQGVALANYDLVLGLDVVDATSDVADSLRRLCSLLTPGGTLALVETTTDDRWLPMVWGLTEGWWNARDGRRAGPLLSVADWSAALRGAGLTDVRAVPRDGEPCADAALLLAARPSQDVQRLDFEPQTDLAPPEKVTDPSRWTYRVSWRSTTEPVAGPPREDQTCLVLGAGELAEQVRSRLERRGLHVVQVEPTGSAVTSPSPKHRLDPRDPQSHYRFVQDLARRGVAVDLVAHLWNAEGASSGLDGVERAMDRGLHSVMDIIRALAGTDRGAPDRLLIATAGGQDVLGGDVHHPEQGVLAAAAKVLPREYPTLSCTLLDLESDSSDYTAQRAESVVAELLAADAEVLVARRGRRRWLPEVVAHQLDAPAMDCVRPGGGYLVCGGLGGVGLAIAEDLLRAGGQVLLTRRTSFPSRDSWARLTADTADGRIARRLLEAERQGGRALVMAADLTDLDAMREVVATMQLEFGGIHGVVHAAGVTDPAGVVQRRDRTSTDAAMAAKMTGTLVLERALAGTELDFVVLCSSIGTELYKLKYGELGYVAANEFLNAFARSRRAAGMPVVAIGWSDWAQGGMWTAARRDLRRRYGPQSPGAALDDLLISLADLEGVEVFRRSLCSEEAHLLVATQDLTALLSAHRKYSVEDHRQAMDGVRLAGIADTPLPPLANSIEESVAGWFCHLLGVDEVGPDDDFFALGGDSLVALRLLSIVDQRSGTDVPLPWFFDHSTVAELANEINRLGQAQPDDEGLI